MLLNLGILILSLALLILAISRWKLHPFFALLLIGLGLGLSLGMGGMNTVEVLLKGFRETLGWIAIIIILGAFIGEVLQETGGAFRISDKIVGGIGPRKLPWALGFTGYLVSIPVFVDVAYILLQPITESLASKSKKPVLYLGLALAAGLTVAHTLIPPTPGPMAVASLLQLDLGRMLLINLFVALFAMSGGVLFVIFFVKDSWLEYDQKLQKQSIDKHSPASSSSQNTRDFLILDLLPIIFPIVLIGLGSFVELEGQNAIAKILRFVSIPLVAVAIGAVIALFQLHPKGRNQRVNRLVEQAILKSALVIMITGAGGAFGYVIKESGVQNDIIQLFAEMPLMGIMLPFLLAAMLTIATGSITVSLVGSASMIGPLAESLPLSPEIIAALIGCGSFCVFHANSSFFWLLNRLHEAPPAVLYRSFTIQSLVMGLTGLVGVLLLLLLGV